MNQVFQKSLEQEFGLPFAAIAEIGEARRMDDLYANGFGSKNIYMEPPINKFDVYKKHGVDLDHGDAIAWAYIWQEMQEPA